jgi:hypothetical protein
MKDVTITLSSIIKKIYDDLISRAVSELVIRASDPVPFIGLCLGQLQRLAVPYNTYFKIPNQTFEDRKLDRYSEESFRSNKSLIVYVVINFTFR